MIFEISAVALATLLVLYWLATRQYSYWRKRGIAYEKPIPVFGNLWDSIIMKRSAGEIATGVYRKFPDEKVVGMFHFDSPVLLVRDPALVYKIFVSDFNYFADNGATIHEDVDPVLSRNMFFQKGERWKKTRQMMSPAFSLGKTKIVFESIVSVAGQMMDYLEKHQEEFELKYLMSRYTSEIWAQCGLGIQGRSFEETKPKIVQMGQLMFDPGTLNGLIQTFVHLAPNVSKIFQIKMVPNEMPKYFRGIISDVLHHREKYPDQSRQDLLQHWIQLKKKSIEVAKGNLVSDVMVRELDDNDVLGGCVTFFIESFETSSMVASFALHYLAVHKDIQDRVKESIDGLYAKYNGELTYDGVAEMKLLDNIILEVLRLHPAIHQALKSCTKEYVMDVGKSKPLVVEKDTVIVIPNFALSNDPLYWKEPAKFNPDRFDEMDKDEWKKGIFMPFGDGPRMCIGTKMGYALVKVALILIIKEYEAIPTAKTPVEVVQDPRHFMSRSKSGLYAKFVKREK